MEKKNLIDKIKNNSHMFNEEKFKETFSEIYKSLKEYSERINITSIPFKEQIYCWVHEYNPYCSLGKKRSFISLVKGYYTGCGKINTCQCAKKLYQKTNFERYGAEHPLKSEKIKKKVKETFDKKYGTKNLHEISINKKKQTNIKRYGAETPLESKMIKNKIKENYIEKYGVSNPFCDSTIQKNIQDTWISINGKKSYIRTKEDGDKISKEFIIKNFGEKGLILLDKKTLEMELKNKTPLMIANEIGCSDSLVYKKIRMLDINFERKKSYYELEISLYLNDLNIFHSVGRRDIIKPKEIDIFIDDFSLAIEFNGLYWHGEKYGRDKNYHKNKLLECNKQEIELIQIFSDEWISNRDIVKSIIKSKLGLNDRIYARKTEIKEIPEKESKQFLENNHLQGNVIGSTKRYGLYYNNELMSIMTFQLKNNIWELKRYANKINTNVVGGASKLFKYFIKENNPEEIFSYCDLRYFNGKIYESLGFTYNKTTQPGYFYVKNSQRYHRLNFTKKKLVKNGADHTKTEFEIMTDLGYDRIWDCGHSKWVWKRP